MLVGQIVGQPALYGFEFVGDKALEIADCGLDVGGLKSIMGRRKRDDVRAVPNRFAWPLWLLVSCGPVLEPGF